MQNEKGGLFITQKYPRCFRESLEDHLEMK